MNRHLYSHSVYHSAQTCHHLEKRSLSLSNVHARYAQVKLETLSLMLGYLDVEC
jgi:hypothetical protein